MFRDGGPGLIVMIRFPSAGLFYAHEPVSGQVVEIRADGDDTVTSGRSRRVRRVRAAG